MERRDQPRIFSLYIGDMRRPLQIGVPLAVVCISDSNEGGNRDHLMAKRPASDGFGIAVHYASNSAKAEAVVAEIEDAGGKANLVRQCKIYGSPV
jgi:hypothetical protein